MRSATHRPAAVALLIASLCFFARTASADLLVNGNFEQGPAIPPANPILAVPPGNTALTGWIVTGGSINIVTDGYWVPLSGTRSVELSSTGPGSIEQAIATSPGAIYRLTFWVSGEPFSLPSLKHLRIAGGETVQDQTFDNTPAWHWDMAWSQRTIDFTATGPTTTVRFSSMDASAWGPALDSAKVELVSAGVSDGAGKLSFAPVSPDPVRGGGRMVFTLAEAGHVRLAVHDIQGRQVALLADGNMPAGPRVVDFSPRDWGARPGIYLASLQVNGRTIVRRFSVIL
jgi:choice-of-anchor C domain-containing protein